MSSEPPLPHLDLPVLAMLVGGACERWLLERLRAEHPQLRRVHGHIFQRLQVDNPTVTELAQSLDVSQQAASKWAAELDELGYVTRDRDGRDGRIRRLALTERAWDAIDTSRAAREQLQAELCDGVTAEEQAATRRVLLALIEATGASEELRHRTVRPPDPRE